MGLFGFFFLRLLIILEKSTPHPGRRVTVAISRTPSSPGATKLDHSPRSGGAGVWSDKVTKRSPICLHVNTHTHTELRSTAPAVALMWHLRW